LLTINKYYAMFSCYNRQRRETMDIHNESLLFPPGRSSQNQHLFNLWVKFVNLLPNIDEGGPRPHLTNEVNWKPIIIGTIKNNCTQRELDLYFEKVVQLYPLTQVYSLLQKIGEVPARQGPVRPALDKVELAIRRALEQVH